MRRIIVFLTLGLLLASAAAAQTDTPVPTETYTPTPTFTPTPEPFVYATVAPAATGEPGTMTRFDYTASAGDVMIAALLIALLLSVWAFFLFGVIVAAQLMRQK